MSTGESRTFRLGTRASKLARWQADWVAARLREVGHTVEIVQITTAGDVEQVGPVADIGAPGVFTKEIQRAMLAGEVDFAVHSLKDLPTDEVAGLTLAAVPVRESPADVLIARDRGFVRLRSRIRRESAPAASAANRNCDTLRPDLRVESVRGNVDTRVRKLDDGQFDAIVLAEAGLKRLGLSRPHFASAATGRGCCRRWGRGRSALNAVATMRRRSPRCGRSTMPPRTRPCWPSGRCWRTCAAVAWRRSGRWLALKTERLRLAAVVLNAEGSRRITASGGSTPTDAISLGRRVADDLLAQDAAELIAASRA